MKCPYPAVVAKQRKCEGFIRGSSDMDFTCLFDLNGCTNPKMSASIQATKSIEQELQRLTHQIIYLENENMMLKQIIAELRRDKCRPK